VFVKLQKVVKRLLFMLEITEMNSTVKSANLLSNEALLTIGELAKACQTTVRTLRYYEELDLIAPSARSAGRYRLYQPIAIKRINAILALQALNYSLDDIVAMMGLASEQQKTKTRQERLLQTKESLLNQQTGIAQKLEVLTQLQQTINGKLQLLTEQCMPCVEQVPNQDCCNQCDHKAIHFG
jgi:DNA-binding transcriptional MerR regulator